MTSSKDKKEGYRQKVYQLVGRIPRGRVMTYGQIAELMGEGYTPRTVGFVMHGSDDGTPWHRVVNDQGGCSTLNLVLPHDKQQRMLESEGVVFDKRGRCDLQTFLWIPGSRAVPRAKEKKKTSLFKRKSASKGKKS